MKSTLIVVFLTVIIGSGESTANFLYGRHGGMRKDPSVDRMQRDSFTDNLSIIRRNRRFHHPVRREEAETIQFASAYEGMRADEPEGKSLGGRPSGIKMPDSIRFVDDSKEVKEVKAPSSECNSQLMTQTLPAPSAGAKKTNWVPKINPANCLSSKYCEDVAEYPMEAITEKLLPNLDSLSNFLSADEELKSQVINVATRIGPSAQESEDMPLCEAKSEIRHPKVGRNKDNQWRFIVNVDNYTQGVLVERCRNENGPCAFASSFPSGFKTICRQKYLYRKLVAVDERGNQVSESFAMPSCCVCSVRTVAPFQRQPLESTSRNLKRSLRFPR